MIMVLLNISPALAWQIPIEVATFNDNGEKIYNKLIAGVEPDATEGFDNLWDAPPLITPPDPVNKPSLRAYFTLPALSIGETGRKTGNTEQALWKDIRGPSDKEIRWDITIDSVPTGKPVIISWDTPQLKPGERLVLRDNDSTDPDGKPVEKDMSQAPGYEFVSYGEEPRSLSMVLSKQASDSSSSSGSGLFGCGTVRPHRDNTHSSGTSALGVVVLFSPVIIQLLRKIRLHYG